LLYFRDRSEAEVGGFGVTDVKDPLLVQEFLTVEQRVTSVSVSFDDEAVADFFDAQGDAGRRPDQFARIWLHTHPGESPQPSGVGLRWGERLRISDFGLRIERRTRRRPSGYAGASGAWWLT
jgi:proteasome lid subunit RPN8/RPN11